MVRILTKKYSDTPVVLWWSEQPPKVPEVKGPLIYWRTPKFVSRRILHALEHGDQ